MPRGADDAALAAIKRKPKLNPDGASRVATGWRGIHASPAAPAGAAAWDAACVAEFPDEKLLDWAANGGDF